MNKIDPKRHIIIKIRAVFICITLIIINFFIPHTCPAREFIQKDGAFKIDVRDDWDVIEETAEYGCSSIYFRSKAEKVQGVGMHIRLCKRLNPERPGWGAMTPPGIKENELLDHKFQEAIDYFKKVERAQDMTKGQPIIKVISQEKITLDGLPAFRTDIMNDFRSRGGLLFYQRMIYCITKDYLYDIFIGSLDEKGDLDLTAVLETIRIRR